MDNDPIVKMEHVRAVGMCSRGARMWFARTGLDFRKFLAEGLPASVIEGTGDALGMKVAQYVRDESGDSA